jgi:hypothetical protein
MHNPARDKKLEEFGYITPGTFVAAFVETLVGLVVGWKPGVRNSTKWKIK